MIANPPEEEILQTRIISPREVARNWPDWLEAVEAEVVSLTEEKEALRVLRRLTKEEHEEIKRKAESQGRKVEYIPSKVVFTVKPIPGGTKKKARWVHAVILNREKKEKKTIQEEQIQWPSEFWFGQRPSSIGRDVS